jgi:hypothetical protein
MAQDADKFESVAAALTCDKTNVAAVWERCVPLLLDPLPASWPLGGGLHYSDCKLSGLSPRCIGAYLPPAPARLAQTAPLH